MCRAVIFACSVLVAVAAMSVETWAQSTTLNPQRDCQELRTCRFTKGGSFRGCVSSYSCRVCKFVTARCSVPGTPGKCQELRCSWG